MGSRYRMDKRGIEKHVLCSEFMKTEMARRGALVLELARARAPFDPKDSDGVHYVEAFSMEVRIKDAIGEWGPTKRAAATISNSDMPTALFVEYGFKGGVDKDGNEYPAQEGRRVLGNALDAAKG